MPTSTKVVLWQSNEARQTDMVIPKGLSSKSVGRNLSSPFLIQIEFVKVLPLTSRSADAKTSKTNMKREPSQRKWKGREGNPLLGDEY